MLHYVCLIDNNWQFAVVHFRLYVVSFLQYTSSQPLQVDGIFQGLHVMNQINVPANPSAWKIQTNSTPKVLRLPCSNKGAWWGNDESITVRLLTERIIGCREGAFAWSLLVSSGQWNIREPECVRVIYKNQQPRATGCSPKQLVVVGACSVQQNTSRFWHTDAAKRNQRKRRVSVGATLPPSPAAALLKTLATSSMLAVHTAAQSLSLFFRLFAVVVVFL